MTKHPLTIALHVLRALALLAIIFLVPGWNRVPWLAGLLAADIAGWLFFTRTTLGTRVWGR